MTLHTAVDELISGCPGALGAAIVDPDGIPVVVQPRDASLEDIGAEFATIIREVDEAERELHHGQLQQFVVTADQAVLIVTLMNEGYYLVLQLRRDGLVGKGRFLSRVTGEKLYSEFT